MIGTQTITALKQPVNGDYDKFQVTVEGPGPTPISFPLTMSGTVSAIWGGNPQQAAEALAKTIVNVSGTASQPPAQGYWFDSYNSGNTIKETENKIYNFGVNPFLKDSSVSTFFSNLLGHDVLEQIDLLNQYFASTYGKAFFRSFDDAFERSQVLDDMNLPPRDNANYLYRICILSGMIDHIQIGEPKENKTIKYFKIWLIGEVGEEKAAELTKCFAMIKDLRKQYPIHEHYDIKNGIRSIREEILKANEYFSITIPQDFDRNWGLILNQFLNTLRNILIEQVAKLS